MGVKLNVGYCQKIGLPNYGSEGAHCNVEVEVDTALLNDANTFQQRIQGIYATCRAAVESQLQQNGGVPRSPAKQTPVASRDRTEDRRDNLPKAATASSKQSKYAEQLAAQVKGLSVQRLDNLCVRMYRKPFASLSGLEAGNLIDTLREAKAGRLDLSGSGRPLHPV